MRTKLLAAAASFAFVAAGVAHAQDNPRHDEQHPAAQRAEPQHPGAQMHREAQPRAAQAEPRRENEARPEGQKPMQGDQHMQGEKPRAAETEHRPQPGETEKRNAETRPTPGEHHEKTATDTHEPKTAPAERTGANAPDHNAMHTAERPGGEATRTAEHNGPVRVMGGVKISNEHATRVSEFLRRDARPEHVNVAVRVGERIPESIVLQPLPSDVVEIVPEYRGYDYFIDSDDEIVFVSPETHEIVGSIDYEGRAASNDVTRVSAARPCPTEQ